MTDIVERLRADGRAFRGNPDCVGPDVTLLVEEAAAEIERLRAALDPFACKCTVRGEGAGGRCETNGVCLHWNARAAAASGGWQ